MSGCLKRAARPAAALQLVSQRAAQNGAAWLTGDWARSFASDSAQQGQGPNVDFGFRQVPREAKESLVGQVFSSVASSYDVMNDLMSGGMHRLWKDRLVEALRPFPGQHHLDVAGGTGDVAFRVLRAIRAAEAEERLAAATTTGRAPAAAGGAASGSGGSARQRPLEAAPAAGGGGSGGPGPSSTAAVGVGVGDFGSSAGSGAASTSGPGPSAPGSASAAGASAGASAGGSGGGSSVVAPGRVVVCDINPDMLRVGQQKAAAAPDLAADAGVSFVEGNAEALPFPDASFDSYTIAFGIRNVTDRPAALREALRVLRRGGRFMCLEFSQVTQPGLRELYDMYSFAVIPRIGQLVANDAASYQYLVESIRRFPDQESFARLIEGAGFRGVSYENMSGGIVAMHSGFKL